MIKAGIVGVTGYTGIELFRLLNQHSEVNVTHCFSRNKSISDFNDVYPFVESGSVELMSFDPSIDYPIDVLFLATPHAQSHNWMKDLVNHKYKIIDLSADFRIPELSFNTFYGCDHGYPEGIGKFVRGFSEIYREQLKNADYCANPGCFSTSVVLGAYPLSKTETGCVNMLVDAKSGVSGKGKKVDESSLYCEVNESTMAYGTFCHRHTPEMELELNCPVLFSPHLVPMNRGILASIYCDNPLGMTQGELSDIYEDTYKDESFVRVVGPESPIKTHYVTGTNNCFIKPMIIKNKILFFSVLDNVIKGASGQAIQNMNIMYGLNETLGLSQLPIFP